MSRKGYLTILVCVCLINSDTEHFFTFTSLSFLFCEMPAHVLCCHYLERDVTFYGFCVLDLNYLHSK